MTPWYSILLCPPACTEPQFLHSNATRIIRIDEPARQLVLNQTLEFAIPPAVIILRCQQDRAFLFINLMDFNLGSVTLQH